ncbi:acyl-protein synthase [Verticiella sediminum]|nr:acyl-protein synthase [Verticiella sediminum]
MVTDMQWLEASSAPELECVRAFCAQTDPAAARDEGQFVRAMVALSRWHAERNRWYAGLLTQHGTDLERVRSLADLADLPSVHANFFKYHEAKSVPDEAIATHLTSSGTTGQKSQMFFDAFTMDTARRMVDDAMRHRGVPSDGAANYLVNAYEPYAGFKVGTSNTNQYLMRYAPVAEAFWTLRCIGEGRHEFDAFGAVQALSRFAASGQPTRIIGFPAFLHFALERMAQMGMPPLRLPAGSWVIFGGGWKGHADKAISRAALQAQIGQWLGVGPEHIVETFGAVEHCIPYVGCACQHLHVPVWSEVLIRDVRTLAPLGYGEPGFLSFLSPYITSVPAHSVVMGDLAVLHPPGSCECGAATPWFEVLGRAGTSSNKSCAAAAAELLRAA